MTLTAIGSPPSPAGMGRPPLGSKPTQIRIPEELKERIRALSSGKYGLAKFIREAIENELKRREGGQ